MVDESNIPVKIPSGFWKISNSMKLSSLAPSTCGMCFPKDMKVLIIISYHVCNNEVCDWKNAKSVLIVGCLCITVLFSEISPYHDL